MNQPIDKQKIMNAILKASGGKISQNSLNGVEKGDLSGVMQALNSEDRQRLRSLLSDKNALQKILSEPTARDLLDKMQNGK